MTCAAQFLRAAMIAPFLLLGLLTIEAGEAAVQPGAAPRSNPGRRSSSISVATSVVRPS